MADVFVSYASGDRERVKELVKQLETVGWDVWWDRAIGAGTTFDREIEKAIDAARCILVVWSEKSVESEWVRTEANEGLEKGNLVPVSIDQVRPPLAFRRTQTVDLSGADAADKIRIAISKFAPPPADLVVGGETPFVGRQADLDKSLDILGQVNSEVGRVLFIAGEVGVGKTRLTRELSNAARDNGFVVLTGQCLDMEGATPYQPLLEQIAQAARVTPTENLRAALGENAPEVAKLMPELRQQFSDIKETPELPPEQERRYLLNGVGDFIERGARVQPMMLVFEDLHCADDSTCILLRHLAQRFREVPIFMVGTYRDDELAPDKPFAATLREMTRERMVEEIFLSCLDVTQVRNLIEGRAGKPAPQELVDLVFTETEGNPFFVEEVFRHLEEADKLFDEKGEFKDGVEIKDTEVPRGLQLVIGERLARVSETCRAVLTVGAVIGRKFGFETLIRAGGKLEDDDVLDAVEDALDAGLIEDLSSDRDARYGFLHEQIRQSLLRSLSLPRRQRVHLRIADAMLAIHGQRADEHAGELSFHLYQAGTAADLDQTVHFLTAAGQRALGSLAFEDARRRFDSAVETLSDDDKRLPGIYRLQATTQCGTGEIDEALASLDRAADVSKDATEQDDILLQRCQILLDVWRGSEAVGDLERLLERKQQGDDREAELIAQQWLSRSYYVMSLDRSGYAEKVKDAYHRTIELADELSNEKIKAHAMIATAQLIDYDRGYFQTAQKHLAEAEKIGQRLGDEEIEIDVATARLNAMFSSDSDALGEAILERLLVRRDPLRLNAHYFRMMWSTYGAMRIERCVEICDAGIELAYRIGTLPVQYPTIKAMALLDAGQFDAAGEAMDAEIADEDHRFGAALQKLTAFQRLLDCGAIEDALTRAPHLIDEAHYLSRIWMLSWIANSLALVAPHRGDDADLIAEIERLISLTKLKPAREGRAALELVRGNLEEANGLITGHEDMSRLGAATRKHMLNVDIHVQLLITREDWSAAKLLLEEALPRLRLAGARQKLWQFLGLQAIVANGCGDRELAAASLVEARQIHAEVAQTISDETVRLIHETGATAIHYGIHSRVPS